MRNRSISAASCASSSGEQRAKLRSFSTSTLLASAVEPRAWAVICRGRGRFATELPNHPRNTRS